MHRIVDLTQTLSPDFPQIVLPPELVVRLHHDIAQALAQPDVRAFYITIGAEPGTLSPDEFDGFFRKETDRLGKLVSTLGLKNE